MIAGTRFIFAPRGVREAIDRAAKKNRRLLLQDFDLGEIIDELRDGRAFVLEHPNGIVVIELRISDNRTELFVRLAAGFRPGAFVSAEAEMISIAQDMGASVLSFIPARRGWERLLGPEWSKHGERFERLITSGQKS